MSATNFPRRPLATTTVATFVVWIATAAGHPSIPQTPAAPGTSTAQTATPTETASIGGRAVDGVTGAPLAGAMVSLHAVSDPAIGWSPRLIGRQVTDNNGRFLFARLPASQPYHVTASKPGYFDGALGMNMSRPTPRRVVLTDGQSLRDAMIPLWKPGSISGTIRDEAGEPVVGVLVTVMAQILVAGVPQFATGPLARSDDRGVYRIAPLTPGTYAVMVPSVQFSMPRDLSALPVSNAARLLADLAEAATVMRDGEIIARDDLLARLAPGQHVFAQDDGTLLVRGIGSPLPPPLPINGRRQNYPAHFHPTARSLREAALIELSPGDERAGADVDLRPVAVSRVSGVLKGQPSTRSLRVRLMPLGSENMGSGHEAANAFTDSSGRFSFGDVPDGQYTVLVTDSGAAGYEYLPPGAVVTPAARTLAGLSGGLPFGPMGSSASQIAIAAGPPTAAALTHVRLATDGGALGGAATGRSLVDVAGVDRNDVVVEIQPGPSVTGRLVFDTPADRAALAARKTELEISADPAGGEPRLSARRARAPLTASALDFTLNNVQPGDYVFRMYSDSGMIKSIQWSGRDYTGVPLHVDQDVAGLVVTVTSQVAQAQGSVRDERGAMAAQAVVIYFPTDPARWRRYGPQPDRVRSVPIKNGRYEISRLPAGDYYLIAVDEGLAGQWKDPGFLEAASRAAVRVTIEWGETRGQDLVVTEVVR